MPHTYQVRDFVPKLATAMSRTAISDCIGYKKEGDKLLFTRQMFQGKLAADVSFACEAPWFVTFQKRGPERFAGTKLKPAPAPPRSKLSKLKSQTASFVTSRRKFSRKPSRRSYLDSSRNHCVGWPRMSENKRTSNWPSS